MQKAPLVHQGDGHLSKIKAVTNDNKLIITARPSITSGSKNVDDLQIDSVWLDAFDNYEEEREEKEERKRYRGIGEFL